MENIEYAGLIYKIPGDCPDGNYSYTPPVAGTKYSSRAHDSPVPSGKIEVGWYHTHGAWKDGYANERFSNIYDVPPGEDNDWMYSIQHGLDGYLGTQGGLALKLDYKIPDEYVIGHIPNNVPPQQ